MNTLLVTAQIVAYGVGAVSASLNIASFVLRRAKWRRIHATRSSKLTITSMIPVQLVDLQTYRLVGFEDR